MPKIMSNAAHDNLPIAVALVGDARLILNLATNHSLDKNSNKIINM